jgi:hypothetical protein
MKQLPSRSFAPWRLCGSINRCHPDEGGISETSNKFTSKRSRFLAIGIGLICCFLFLSSCKKFLDAKPDQKLAVPRTVTDLALLLDNHSGINTAYPYEPETLSDNYYLAPADWLSLTNAAEKAYHVWAPDDSYTLGWSASYTVVFYANNVLDNIDKASANAAEAALREEVRGRALFFRGFALYGLSQLFAPPYNAATAANDPGLPLRLTADFNPPSVRASVAATYAQVLSDLEAAAARLPVSVASKNRPSRPAAFAALARTALAMGDWAAARDWADSCLRLNSTLMDYNTLSATAAAPFARFNPEVLFWAISPAQLTLVPSRYKVDSTLYASYAAADLRKTLFYKSNGNGTFAFKGDYDGTNSGAVFVGLTTDEAYLVKAEAEARLGATAPAMAALNALLQKRWKTGTFVPLAAASPAEALSLVLRERRKELVFRGQRWTDLRRLSLDPALAVTPRRVINGTVYTLVPGSPRYTLLLPRLVIDLSGMPQNP